MNGLDNNKNTKRTYATSQTTTIVKEVRQKELPQENTSPNKASQEKNTARGNTQSCVKEEKDSRKAANPQDPTTPATSKPTTGNELANTQLRK